MNNFIGSLFILFPAFSRPQPRFFAYSAASTSGSSLYTAMSVLPIIIAIAATVSPMRKEEQNCPSLSEGRMAQKDKTTRFGVKAHLDTDTEAVTIKIHSN